MVKLMNFKKYSFAYLVYVLLFFISCGQQHTGEEKGIGERVGRSIDNAAAKTGDKLVDIKDGTVDKAEQAGEYITDGYITSKIKAKILQDPLINVFQIKVITTDGVVQLTGEVDSALNISRALEVVNSVKGVKSTSMKLTIKKDE